MSPLGINEVILLYSMTFTKTEAKLHVTLWICYCSYTVTNVKKNNHLE